MKAIMCMFDSLNRNMLSPYGCDWTATPNFQRLAEHSVMFMNNYVGSLPCMPARRELHTGRYNFLHRSWGPLEPFDDSMPELLDRHGVHTHLVSDHIHYWEDGGATYHNRYSTWEIIRGQEGDHWQPDLSMLRGASGPQNKDAVYFQGTNTMHKQDAANRKSMSTEEKMPLAMTFESGLAFLDRNRDQDRWFLQIECFDPHEPFFSAERYKKLYPHDYEGPTADWPPYHNVTEDEKTARHYKLEYAALLSMCDHYLGKLLDKMDELDLWKDTMLIVNTDHGYLLGEHGWWSKVVMPVYNEIGRTPLFIFDPRSGHVGTRRSALTQMIDIPATLLEYFDVPLPKDMQGRSLRPVIERDSPIRDYALFGIHGAHVNVTDGRYVYMKAPVEEKNEPLYDYTLMPTHMRCRFSPAELRQAELVPPMPFSKNCPMLRVPCPAKSNSDDFSRLLMEGADSEAARRIDNNSLVNAANFGDKLYDLETDPRQEHSLTDLPLEFRMGNLLLRAMRESDAPEEQYTRLGLIYGEDMSLARLTELHAQAEKQHMPELLPNREWSVSAVNTCRALMKFIPSEKKPEALEGLRQWLDGQKGKIDTQTILQAVKVVIPPEYVDMVSYFIGMAGRVD